MAKLKVKMTEERAMGIRANLAFGETFLDSEANAIASGRFPCFQRMKTRRRRSALYVAPASLTLEEYLSNGLNRAAFLGIVAQTVAAIRVAERARFNVANLELDTRYTLVNALNGQMYFLYQPIRGVRQQNLNVFLRDVLNKSNFPTEADTDFLRAFDELVSRPRMVSLQELDAYVQQYSGKWSTPASGAQGAPAWAGAAAFDAPPYCGEAPIPPWEMANGPACDETRPAGAPAAHTGTTLLDGSGPMPAGTTRLPEPAQKPAPELIRQRTGEHVPITAGVFRIGKTGGAADYCVDDNPAVSRRHADICERSDAYYIVDQNSTNHTFVDGFQIPARTEFPLTDGCAIRLADEDFIFQLRQG